VADAHPVPVAERGHPARRLVIAIDGPSGSGKSTVARAVAGRLRLRYLDSGAMYRAVTWLALQDRIDLEDAETLAGLAAKIDLRIGTDPAHPTVTVAETDVASAIRTRAVTNAVSVVSSVPGVRLHLVRRQREIIGAGGIVVEGRDIGQVVVPDAQLKIFLTATSETRAERRTRDLTEVSGPVDRASELAQTRAEIERRDRLDTTRVTSPLVRADEALVIDSTALTVDEVVALIVAQIPGRLPAGRGADR